MRRTRWKDAARALKNIQFCSSSRKAIISTTGIHLVFRGLKFEPDAEIGQKGVLYKALAALFLISVSTCILIVTGCSREKPVTDAGVKNKELAGHTSEFRQDIIKVTDGVYTAIGYGLANSILIEGKDGVIVVDVMESVEAAMPVKKAFDKITSKPLKALIYTHYHADHVFGASVFTENKKVDVYSHEKTLEELDRVTTVTQEVTYKRAMRMFGTFLKEGELKNCGIGPFLKFNHKNSSQLCCGELHFSVFLHIFPPQNLSCLLNSM